MRTRGVAETSIGLATGFTSGLLGVGGGLVIVPGMVYLLKTSQREAHGTSLAVIIPVALVGAFILGRSHQVDIPIGIILALGAVGGAVVGARLTSRLSPASLRRAFGILSLAVAALMIGDAIAGALRWSVALQPIARPTGVSLWVAALALGLVAGVLSGLLGIGGGVIMVPGMVLLMGLSQHLAQGTSLAVIIPTALSGGITHFRLGNIRLQTAAWLSLGGIGGAVLGALAALAVPDQILRVLFGIYLSLLGSRMLWPRRQGSALE